MTGRTERQISSLRYVTTQGGQLAEVLVLYGAVVILSAGLTNEFKH